MTDLNSLANREKLKRGILKWAGEIQTWGFEWVTGIYPGEMAAFLGLCEMVEIHSIIESGRGDHAYSTQILGEYSERTGARVVSIDYRPIEEKGFSSQLMRYKNLRCDHGDTYDVLPRAAHRLPGPLALLIDGPKLQEATKISAVASTLFDIRVISHHNFPSDSTWGQEFTRIFPGSFYYEGLGLASDPVWQAFKKWENDCVGGYEKFDEVHDSIGRSLQKSSLIMAVLPSDPPFNKRALVHDGEGVMSAESLRTLRRKWTKAKFRLKLWPW